ncbi:MAG: M23 family metallopeptidase [Gammaproteobacteria bacterium]|nr:M23 family metallopeptidase [Gammaproteobacteria bacterium]
MKIILVKDNTAKNSAVCFAGHKLVVSGLALFVALPIVLGLATYWIASSIDRAVNPFVDPEYRLLVETRVAEQDQEMQKTREYVRQHLDVLGSRIGALQAQVSRINAVEMRIADASGIDLADFQFDDVPAVGGASLGRDVTEQVDIENAIVAIENELALRESEIAAVDFLLSRKNLLSKQTPTGWPVKGGWVSSSFGTRMHPITGRKDFHRGVDIPGKLGADVLAVADGVVTQSRNNASYGWLVEIDHGNGYTTLYSHNKKNTVKVGETVVKGQTIAKIGSTGLSTGPHVHFEVSKNNKRINPIRYLYKRS